MTAGGATVSLARAALKACAALGSGAATPPRSPLRATSAVFVSRRSAAEATVSAQEASAAPPTGLSSGQRARNETGMILAYSYILFKFLWPVTTDSS